jgi:predicted methyltransferase
MPLPVVVEMAQLLAARSLREGAVAIDATAGNGYDTLFLAQYVGPSGRVFGFDVQAQALEETRRRLEASGVADRAELIRGGHEHLKQHVQRAYHRRVGAVMFNLGFLPGGDKEIITRPDTTLAALSQAFDLLAPEGVITIVLYPAHPGGADEARRVEKWAAGLPREQAEVYAYRPFNVLRNAPRLLAVSKRRSAVRTIPQGATQLA